MGLPSSPRSAQHQRCGWPRCALLPHARWGHKGYLRQRLAVGWLAAGLGSVRPLGDGIWTGLVCRHCRRVIKVVCAGDLSSRDSLDGRATTLTLCAAWPARPPVAGPPRGGQIKEQVKYRHEYRIAMAYRYTYTRQRNASAARREAERVRGASPPAACETSYSRFFGSSTHVVYQVSAFAHVSHTAQPQSARGHVCSGRLSARTTER